MPLYFFDTSALVKRYHVESGSEKVDEIFKDPDGILVIASITIAEFVSAFARKLNEGIISEDDLRICLSEFSKDIISSFWIIDLERSHINKSVSLIIKHNLRTLDSLQFAVFSTLSPINPTMVTSDEALLNATVKEGSHAIKP
ncbi:MAG: type II toxin-antitoxin system VapC family toxin [Nitrospirae bacterium]|nr:type II toxin-antitoxin system VapC family toxin [Nitrospirota bacterium]